MTSIMTPMILPLVGLTLACILCPCALRYLFFPPFTVKFVDMWVLALLWRMFLGLSGSMQDGLETARRLC